MSWVDAPSRHGMFGGGLSSRDTGSMIEEANEETLIIEGEVSRRIMAAFLALITTILTSFLPILNKHLLRDARPALVAWITNAASLPSWRRGRFCSPNVRLPRCKEQAHFPAWPGFHMLMAFLWPRCLALLGSGGSSHRTAGPVAGAPSSSWSRAFCFRQCVVGHNHCP